ncbi:MAG TPA: MFS transporter, partial [Thermomicrobiales bacterium]|nr:MFS transporter [Thermomicrobiales bacterium]
FIFGLFFLHEHREKTPGRFDALGFGLAGVGFALVMFALSEGPSRGWTLPWVYVPAIVGALVLAVFVGFELRTPEPMMQFGLLTNRLFRTTLLVSFFATVGFIGLLFLVPLYLQEARGVSPLVSGLTTFPEAIGVLVSTQLVAKIYPRVGPRRLMAGGLTGVAISMILLSLTGLETDLWVIRALMFMLGAGMAYIFLPNQAASLATISREQTGRASTFSSVQRQLGAALGVAILSTTLAFIGPTVVDALGQIEPNLAAYRGAFRVAAVFAVGGALIALAVPDHEAAGTMAPRAARREVEEAPVFDAA